ncbi:MAG: ABC transporter permease [Phycisphaerales bacterium]|nr:ABC transporter permease [Phycisphaerales bacterium]
MIAIQTWALIVDAYRELNSRKLFWLTLGLSALIAGVYGLVGVNEAGIKVAWFQWNNDILNSKLVPPAVFYKQLFVGLGIQLWLGWAATILALLSTAGIIPDLVASGSIELTLSKPISRLRLFATKYLTGLMFVALQVGLFTGACFLVIGLRGGVWEPGLFVAVPLVLFFFSLLFCVCVLIGMVTRSTVAALLLTILFWLVLFLVDLGETSLHLFRQRGDLIVQRGEALLERRRAELADLTAEKDRRAAATPPPATSPDLAGLTDKQLDERIAWRPDDIAALSERIPKERSSRDTIALYHGVLYWVKTVLPKVGETKGLTERYLVSMAELEPMREAQAERREERRENRGQPRRDTRRPRGTMDIIRPAMDPLGVPADDPELTRRVEADRRSRSEWWILGTSGAFQLVVLAVAAGLFIRRDF